MVFGAAGAAQTPKISDFQPAQKPCIKNPSVTGTQRGGQPSYHFRSVRPDRQTWDPGKTEHPGLGCALGFNEVLIGFDKVVIRFLSSGSGLDKV